MQTREKYVSSLRIPSTMKSSTNIVVTRLTDADVVRHKITDESVVKPSVAPLTLSSHIRDTKARMRRYRKWSFHTLDFDAYESWEEQRSWTAADSSGGTRKWTGSGNMTQFLIGSFYPSGIPSWPVPQDLSDLTILKASGKALAYLDRPSLTLGEPIAELRTLPRDIDRPLQALGKQSRRYKTALQAIQHIPKKHRLAAGIWSKYSFFIGPLVREVQDICSEYAEKIDVPPDLWQTARGKEKTRSPVVTKLTNGTGSGWAWTFEQQVYWEWNYHFGIVFHSPDRVSNVPGRLGLVARDLPSTIWELAPLSFIVDRMVNVKRFLRTSAALTSSKVEISPDSFVSGRLLKVNRCRFVNLRSPTIPAAHYTPNTTPWWTTENFSLDRTRWSPGLSDVIPTTRGDGLANTLTKALDLASIIVGRLT